jgi:hypothetical protein
MIKFLLYVFLGVILIGIAKAIFLYFVPVAM